VPERDAREVLWPFRGRVGGRVCPAHYIARGFGRAAAARAHLVIPTKPVEALSVPRPPQRDCVVRPIGSGVFPGSVWAGHGRGSKRRDVSSPAGRHDFRDRHPVEAGREKVGLAAAGIAASPKVHRARPPFPRADIYRVGAEDRLRRGPFAGRNVDRGWRDLAGTGPLSSRGARRSSCCCSPGG
jgi:hypothetical protein